MSKPTWDDTEEITDVPKFEETVDLQPEDEVMNIPLSTKPERSMLESAGRGAVQGATFGFGEEIGAAALSPLETLRAKVSEYISGTPENVDKQLREQGFTGDIQSQDIIDKYKELRDTTREANKAAQEANPWTYGIADVAGGVLPAIATGGGTAAAQVGTTLGRQATKQAAKTGAKYGAASGLGYGESDLTEGDISGAATDVAIGGVLGGALGAATPAIVKGGKQALQKTGETLKRGAKAITPMSELMEAGYKYGKEGKIIDLDVIDKDTMKLAKEIVSDIETKYKNLDLQGKKDYLASKGITVDVKENVNKILSDLKQLANESMEPAKVKTAIKNIQKKIGVSSQEELMTQKAEKNALRKLLESQGKDNEAIIKAEKQLAKLQEQGNFDITNVDDLAKIVDDIGPTQTQEGILLGKQATFEPAGEGDAFTKKILSDATPYQPKISKEVAPDGRPVITTEDLGSGKISAMVGDIENLTRKDLQNMSVSEAEDLRKLINNLQKSFERGSAERNKLKELALKINDATNKSLDEAGDASFSTARQQASDLLAGEQLLGTVKKKSGEIVRKDISELQKAATLADRLSKQGGSVKTRESVRKGTELLGEDIMTPQRQDRVELLQELYNLSGVRNEAGETINKGNLFRQAAGKIPNIAGRFSKKVSDNVSAPVLKAKEGISNLTDDELMKFGNRLLQTENKGLQGVGQRFLDAVQMEDTAKNQLLWSLSQSPAMREFIRRQAESVEQDEEVMFTPQEETKQIVREPSSAAPAIEETQEESSSNFDDIIGQRESSNDYTAVNRLGYLGKYQFGGMALEDLGYKDSKGNWTGKDGIESKEDFLDNPEAQEKAFSEWKPILKRYLNSNGAMDYVGQDFNGIKVTEEGLMAAAHLVGANGVAKMLESGEVPEDANGTKATDYMRMFEDSQESGPSQNPDLQNLLKSYADQELPINREDGGMVKEAPSEADISSIERSIDQINQMQSSGDMEPVDPIDDLLGKIEKLGLSEEQTDDLQEEAVQMTGYSQGLALKEKIKKLTGA